MYNRDEWIITSIEDIPSHKVKRYKFKSDVVYSINGYPAYKCVDVETTSDEEAWIGLEEYIKKEMKNKA